MADKKESALGAVTDFAQARVLDASGASKNIDKATMASVLAGQLGLYSHGFIGTMNANRTITVKKNGFYSHYLFLQINTSAMICVFSSTTLINIYGESNLISITRDDNGDIVFTNIANGPISFGYIAIGL